jgi:hypothetical protein
MCGLERNNAEMATCFAFATHFAECRDPAPRAIVTGIDTWEVLQFLKLLGCFCDSRSFFRTGRPLESAGGMLADVCHQ